MEGTDTAASEEKRPLTRADVERLIAEHGGPERLNLSNCYLPGADLNVMDLHGIIFRRANFWDADRQKGANLRGANLQGADLFGANLQGASLIGANLQGASLIGANLQSARLMEAKLQSAALSWAELQGAFLLGANLQGADLRGANLQDARLTEVNLQGAHLAFCELAEAKSLDSAILGRLGEEMGERFTPGADGYRRLKQWFTAHGHNDRAGEFYYREQECKRKAAWEGALGSARWRPWHLLSSFGRAVRRLPSALRHPLRSLGTLWQPLWQWPGRFLYALWLEVIRLLAGYGERPQRVAIWGLLVVFGCALGYWGFGSVTGDFPDPRTFGEAVYASAVSFTAIGYGNPEFVPTGAARGAAAAEAFLGVFTIALFLVTFTRKMTRGS